jgi:hypothetical protein
MISDPVSRERSPESPSTIPEPSSPSDPQRENTVSAYDRAIKRLTNRPLVAAVMVFATGVAGGSTLIENVAKLWSRIGMYVASDEGLRTLHGRVHAFGDSHLPVAGASVLIGLDREATVKSDTRGEFEAIIPADQLGKHVLVSIRAYGYAPFDFPALPLVTPLAKLEIPLSPLVDPGPAARQDVTVVGRERRAVEDPLDFTTFEFDYTFDPPGRRRWTKIDDRLWIEVYQDNKLSFFPVLEKTAVDGCVGVIVAKSPISRFDEGHRTITFNADTQVQQIFIPGKDCRPLWLRFRFPPSQDWLWLQEMHNAQ